MKHWKIKIGTLLARNRSLIGQIATSPPELDNDIWHQCVSSVGSFLFRDLFCPSHLAVFLVCFCFPLIIDVSSRSCSKSVKHLTGFLVP